MRHGQSLPMRVRLKLLCDAIEHRCHGSFLPDSLLPIGLHGNLSSRNVLLRQADGGSPGLYRVLAGPNLSLHGLRIPLTGARQWPKWYCLVQRPGGANDHSPLGGYFSGLY